MVLQLNAQARIDYSGKYICEPCNAACDTIAFGHPGTCPHCQMGLRSLDSILVGYNKLYDAQVLREDLNLYQRALETSHPALYWHISKDSLDAEFHRGYSKLSKPMAVSEFHKIVRSITATIGDYHMDTRLPSLYSHVQKTNGKYFPFDITYSNGKGYILENKSNDPTIQVGSEIIKINNEPLDSITRELFKYIMIDNNTETFKYRRLENSFADYYFSFYDSPKSFMLELDYEGKRKKVRVKALNANQIEKNNLHKGQNENKKTKSFIQSTSEPLSLHFFPESSTAVLKIKIFSDGYIRDHGLEFTRYMDSTFLEIEERDIKNLVIDIRGNIGGSSGNGSYLFSYLTQEAFTEGRYMELKRIPLKYWNFEGITDSKGDTIVFKEEDFTRTSEGRFRVKDYPTLQEVRPKKNSFKGNLYVLIDGLVGSQASSFASLVHHYKRGTFIGEETGGNYNGNTGGTWANLTLPNTKVEIQMFVFKILRFNDPSHESRGIIPDVPVRPTIKDKLNGIDLELETALQLIKAGE